MSRKIAKKEAIASILAAIRGEKGSKKTMRPKSAAEKMALLSAACQIRSGKIACPRVGGMGVSPVGMGRAPRFLVTSSSPSLTIHGNADATKTPMDSFGNSYPSTPTSKPSQKNKYNSP